MSAVNNNAPLIPAVPVTVVKSPPYIMQPLPQTIRAKIAETLGERDLGALQIAIGAGKSCDQTNLADFQGLQRRVSEAYYKIIADKILKDHPTWTPHVDGWKGISWQDKVWILRVYELYFMLDIKLPLKNNWITWEHSPESLSATRETITKALAEIRELDFWHKGLKKFPDALCLLPNLKSLELANNEELGVAPDVSQNLHLEYLGLRNTGLKEPPNVKRNVKLKTLILGNNKLTKAPDLSRNIALCSVDIELNQLTTLPDLRNNVNLVWFFASNNPFTEDAKEQLQAMNKANRFLKLEC